MTSEADFDPATRFDEQPVCAGDQCDPQHFKYAWMNGNLFQRRDLLCTGTRLFR